MKKVGRYILVGIVLCLLVVIAIVSFDYGKKKSMKVCHAEYGRLMSIIDSLAGIPPDTVTITDTIWPDPTIKWKTKFVKTTETTGTYFYRDSLVNDELAFYVLDSIKGSLSWRSLGYQLFVPREITVTETVTEQVPVFIDKPVPTYYDGFWLGAKVGGGSEFAYNLGFDYAKGRNRYGVEYLRFGGTNNWMVGYSRLIYSRK